MLPQGPDRGIVAEDLPCLRVNCEKIHDQLATILRSFHCAFVFERNICNLTVHSISVSPQTLNINVDKRADSKEEA